MPPGLTIGMKTSRIELQLRRTSSSSHSSRAQQRAHVVEHELRADALEPVNAAEEADGRGVGVTDRIA